MKNVIAPLVVLTALILAGTASAQNVSTGISIADGELRSFYLAIGDYYRVPEPKVVHVKQHTVCATRNFRSYSISPPVHAWNPKSSSIFGFGKG